MTGKGRKKRNGRSGWDEIRREGKATKSWEWKGKWGEKEKAGKIDLLIECIFATDGTWHIWHASSLSLSWRGR